MLEKKRFGWVVISGIILGAGPFLFAESKPQSIDYSITRGEAVQIPAKKAKLPLIVYGDNTGMPGTYVPSGYMGDSESMKVKAADFSAPLVSSRTGTGCLKIEIVPKGREGWVGLYWQTPANNWGKIKGAGYDLSQAKRLTFWARGEHGGERVTEFKFGGLIGPYPDTDSGRLGPLKLGKEWTKYTINLEGKDLRHIIGGFAFSVRRADNPRGAVFYLDEIMFEGDAVVEPEPPVQIPVAEPVAVSTAALAPVGPQLAKPIKITVPFSNAREAFRGDNKAAMDEFAAAAQKYATAAVLVDGHTDDIGPDDMNQKLSVQRAQSVADYLVTKGVPKNRIVVTGYGEDRPVREGSNATPQGRMENRRVELTLEQR